jgi:hypothetical protein
MTSAPSQKAACSRSVLWNAHLTSDLAEKSRILYIGIGFAWLFFRQEREIYHESQQRFPRTTK